MQILPDAGQVLDDPYAHLAEVAGWSDTRQEQQLRGVDRPAAHDHLGPGGFRLDAPVLLVFPPRAAPAVEGEAAGQRAGERGQVRPVPGRMQVRRGGTLPTAVDDAQLIPARALLQFAVEVAGGGVASFLRRSQED